MNVEIPRYHCVLQYKAFAEENEPSCGWYLYDLGSSHKTYLNKACLKSMNYTRIRVGHQIKIGTSTRTYIVLVCILLLVFLISYFELLHLPKFVIKSILFFVE